MPDAAAVRGVLDAVPARRVAPALRNVQASAHRRVHQEAQAALVAARPRPRVRALGQRRSSFLQVPCGNQLSEPNRASYCPRLLASNKRF